MNRRQFAATALALPFASAFAPLERLTAASRDKVKITGIVMKPVSGVSHTLIRIDTDAGVSGIWGIRCEWSHDESLDRALWTTANR